MKISVLLIGILVISGLFFAIAIPTDPGVLLIRNAVKCADAPNLFKSLESQGNKFNKTYKPDFIATKSSLSSARSTLFACSNSDYDCASKAYVPFDALMQQATALYFKAGFLGVLYNGYSWYLPSGDSVMGDYNGYLANYRSCVHPIIT